MSKELKNENTVVVKPRPRRIVVSNTQNTLALPRFGTRVNLIKKPVQKATTVLDNDGFLKPTKHFQTPKTMTSSSSTKPSTNRKKIHKPKQTQHAKTYNSLKYIQLKSKEKQK